MTAAFKRFALLLHKHCQTLVVQHTWVRGSPQTEFSTCFLSQDPRSNE